VVTRSIERVGEDGSTWVRKRLSGRNPPDAPGEWRASSAPRHWNYWRREALVYRSGLGELLDGTGVRLPEVLEVIDIDAHTVELRLEDVDGRSGAELQSADYLRVCHAWGYAQARLSRTDLLDEPWTSRRFVRRYVQSKPVRADDLKNPWLWRQPLIVDNWSADLQPRLIRMWERQEALFEILEAAHQAPSHLDFWPNNVFVDVSGVVVLLDWAFFGAGAYGEDVGNFIPDAVFDGFMPSSQLPRASEQMIHGYIEGLAAGGCRQSVQSVWRNVRASAVKYVWLGPLLLRRAAGGAQQAYGGDVLIEANEQYRERGRTLEFLCAWAEQALSDG